MIQGTIKLLQLDEHYNLNETVEIAKGRDEYITSLEDFKRKLRRLWQSRRQ